MPFATAIMPQPTEMGSFAPDPIPNRYLRSEDWTDPRYATLREDFNRIYRDELDGEPHPFGSRDPESIVTHWSREWEYPWVVVNGMFAPGMRVADLGCGGSPLLLYLARCGGCECVGVDLGFRSKTGRHNLRGFVDEPSRMFPDIHWLQESMDATSIESASMDRVLCVSVLEHVGEAMVRSTLEEVRRVLKPGGLAVLTTDVGGDHRTLTIPFERIIEIAAETGLTLHGRSDWSVPERTPGLYNVVGFVLRKS